MLDLRSPQVAWANGNAWAPAIEEKLIDGKYKYFFYYSGNPKNGGGKQIGVAIADSPTGPFVDLGYPIVTESPVGGGQQIDVDVFTRSGIRQIVFVLGKWLYGRCRTECRTWFPSKKKLCG